MIRRPPRSTQSRSSAASDVYKRQEKQLKKIPNATSHAEDRVTQLCDSRSDKEKAASSGYADVKKGKTDERNAKLAVKRKAKRQVIYRKLDELATGNFAKKNGTNATAAEATFVEKSARVARENEVSTLDSLLMDKK
eukprot:TRINITY_DN23375_c0_g1_i1.p1 TRINITY_DN23375_c0_g1~~TRINITY_DN23375_c0_g1_i1.p1  ORF type:complete len:137 (-),score=68.93 TRINITY_DN23375_c0_g1_i1:333-743(-)